MPLAAAAIPIAIRTNKGTNARNRLMMQQKHWDDVTCKDSRSHEFREAQGHAKDRYGSVT